MKSFTLYTVLLLLTSCLPKNFKGTSLTIAATPASSNGLICLANNTLNDTKASENSSGFLRIIEIKNSDEGFKLLNENKVDVVVADPDEFFKNYLNSLNKKNELKILASINNVQNSISIMTPKNSTITETTHLRNKKLGYTSEVSEFFRTYFFLTEGLNETTIKQRFFKSTEKLVRALNKKTIDAAIIPHNLFQLVEKSKYNFFVSNVHEVSSQIIVKKETISLKREALTKLLSELIYFETFIYSDPNEGLKQLKKCYPQADQDFMAGLIKRRDLRILIDESLRYQYALFQKWLLFTPEFKQHEDVIKSFDLLNQLDSSILREIDYRRVLLK